jgi:hypothetical protein
VTSLDLELESISVRAQDKVDKGSAFRSESNWLSPDSDMDLATQGSAVTAGDGIGGESALLEVGADTHPMIAQHPAPSGGPATIFESPINDDSGEELNSGEDATVEPAAVNELCANLRQEVEAGVDTHRLAANEAQRSKEEVPKGLAAAIKGLEKVEQQLRAELAAERSQCAKLQEEVVALQKWNASAGSAQTGDPDTSGSHSLDLADSEGPIREGVHAALGWLAPRRSSRSSPSSTPRSAIAPTGIEASGGAAVSKLPTMQRTEIFDSIEAKLADLRATLMKLDNPELCSSAEHRSLVLLASELGNRLQSVRARRPVDAPVPVDTEGHFSIQLSLARKPVSSHQAEPRTESAPAPAASAADVAELERLRAENAKLQAETAQLKEAASKSKGSASAAPVVAAAVPATQAELRQQGAGAATAGSELSLAVPGCSTLPAWGTVPSGVPTRSLFGNGRAVFEAPDAPWGDPLEVRRSADAWFCSDMFYSYPFFIPADQPPI